MPDYVEALRILSRLPNNLNGLFMEQETKTVTMPLSEYEDMRAKIASKEARESEIEKRIETAKEEQRRDTEKAYIKLIGIERNKLYNMLASSNSGTISDYYEEKIQGVYHDCGEEISELKKSLLAKEREIDLLKDIIRQKDEKLKRKWYEFWK